MTPTPPPADIEAIRKRHEADKVYAVSFSKPGRQRHDDRGTLLALLSTQGAVVTAQRAGVPSHEELRRRLRDIAEILEIAGDEPLHLETVKRIYEIATDSLPPVGHIPQAGVTRERLDDVFRNWGANLPRGSEIKIRQRDASKLFDAILALISAEKKDQTDAD